MKKLVVIITVCFSLNLMSQTSGGNNSRLDNLGLSSFGNGMWVKSSSQQTKIKGSPYLYESWFNNGKIYTNNKMLSVMSLNYNMKFERFEAKISEDSIFAIDPGGIKKIEIKGNEFIRALDPDFQRNSYFQKIASINGKFLLEKHIVDLKEGQINPMTMQKAQKDMLIKKELFYISNGSGSKLKKIKLKKSTILSLVNKNKISNVKLYAKQNKLRYNNVKDVQVLLEYANTI